MSAPTLIPAMARPVSGMAPAVLWHAVRLMSRGAVVVVVLSPYEHLHAVPYEDVNWAGTTGMTLIAAALALLGVIGFQRRDLRG
jgi:putative exporter of polyketide antibiotics